MSTVDHENSVWGGGSTFFFEVCTPKLMNSLKVGYSNVLGVATDVMRLEIGLSKLVGIVLYFLSQLKFG